LSPESRESPGAAALGITEIGDPSQRTPHKLQLVSYHARASQIGDVVLTHDIQAYRISYPLV